MKKILILNGAGNKNGNTAKMIAVFKEGACENEIHEFYLQNMNIKGCINCQCCSKKEPRIIDPCFHKDDMVKIYNVYTKADVIVFASPIYWWTITGTLKTAVDRLYAIQRNWGFEATNKESVLLMTAGGNDYSIPLGWYQFFEKILGWKNLGAALGINNIKEAKRIGESIR